ncbi:MAG: DUF4089 domain-containing protein [Cyanobacteria bacterium J06642_11]
MTTTDNASSSKLIEQYVIQTLALLEISVPDEQLVSVVENFEQVKTIAHSVLDFPLDNSLEMAPTFEP